MDAIAARCRISKQTLYRLFPGKGELFVAVLDTFRRHMLDFSRAHPEMPFQEALEAVFLPDLSQDEERQRGEFIAMIVSESRHNPELHDLMHRYGGMRSRDELADWLAAEAQRRGIALRFPEPCAGMLMDMVFGPMAVKHLCRGETSLEERRAHVRRAIHVFLHGAVSRVATTAPTEAPTGS